MIPRKASCVADGCGKPFFPDTPEARSRETLKAFWYLYCPEHRVTAKPQTAIVGRPVTRWIVEFGKSRKVYATEYHAYQFTEALRRNGTKYTLTYE